jgi:hypothetical protein
MLSQTQGQFDAVDGSSGQGAPSLRTALVSADLSGCAPAKTWWMARSTVIHCTAHPKTKLVLMQLSEMCGCCVLHPLLSMLLIQGVCDSWCQGLLTYSSTLSRIRSVLVAVVVVASFHVERGWISTLHVFVKVASFATFQHT